MIQLNLTYTSIDVNNGIVSKLFGSIIPKILEIPTNDICYCQFDCEYYEKVFATVDGVDWWKNDKSTLPLFQKIVATDTITLEMYKDGVKVDDVDNNTYGDFYDSFSLAPLYVGFVADWFKIKEVFGYGNYYFKVLYTQIGTSKEYFTHNYRLMPYSDYLANDTVRIESYQTGGILSSPFDFSLLLPELPNGWYNSYRIKGNFGKKTPKLEVVNYVNSNYVLQQIQDKIKIEYQLETNLLPSDITNVLVYDNMLSNTLLITDYNIFNSEILRRISVYPIDISIVKHLKNNRNQVFSIKFADKNENNIKSNN